MNFNESRARVPKIFKVKVKESQGHLNKYNCRMNYKRIYESIVARGKERVIEGYKERHHIIPRCMGGTDDPTNLVDLTPEEHFVCHQLLVKIYPDHRGLIYAVMVMTGTPRSRSGKSKNKMYGWVRVRVVEALKARKGNMPAISEMTRQKMRESHLGRNTSEETRLKIGAASRLKILSSEARRKVSEARKGTILSEEHKRKISDAHKGKKRRPFTEEHKRKIGESRVGKVGKKRNGSLNVICQKCGVVYSVFKSLKYTHKICRNCK